jgi:hypothetical protein
MESRVGPAANSFCLLGNGIEEYMHSCEKEREKKWGIPV